MQDTDITGNFTIRLPLALRSKSANKSMSLFITDKIAKLKCMDIYIYF